MKKIVRKLLLFALCSVFLFAIGCGNYSGDEPVTPVTPSDTEQPPQPPQQTQTVDYETYQSFWVKQADYKTMPVCAYNAFATAADEYYTKDMYNAEYVKWLSEAGFNVAFARENVNDPKYKTAVKESLENCAEYGISYIASVTGADTYTDANILESAVYASLIKDKPAAFGGIMVKDEPSSKQFASLAKSVDTFKTVFSQSRYNGLLYHMNLFPNYATVEQWCGDKNAKYTYEQYVNDYLQTVKPSFLSYDYYPCERAFPHLSGDYFANMSLIRKKAAQSKIPFWVYIQSCTWGGSERAVTQAENDWQVNAALAYGAKGMQYFCYVTPGLNGEEKFAAGCISRDGKRTDMYYIAQQTNKQIAAVDEVLMCSLSRGVMVAGNTPCEIPQSDVIVKSGVLNGVAGKHALVGCFDYDDTDAYYAVNNSITESDEITLNFASSVGGYTVTDGKKENFSNKKSLTVSLKAGKGVLIVIAK